MLLLSPVKTLKTDFLCPLMSIMDTEQLQPHAVQSRLDVIEASHLLYSEYRKRNFCPKVTLQLHYSPYMFLEDSRTFLMRKSDETIGTLSVYPDSDFNLPIDGVFPAEMRELRKQDVRLAEIGLFALDTSSTAGGSYGQLSLTQMHWLFSLMRMAVQYSLLKDRTHLLMLVPPRLQEAFSYMSFVPFAYAREYSLANDKLVVPMILDLKMLARERPFLMRLLLKGASENESLFRTQLAEAPEAFKELFPESYHTFVNDKIDDSGIYKRPNRPRVFLGYELGT